MNSRLNRPLPKSHKKVLLYISMEGPKTKYEIEKGTRINHASIFEAIKNLNKLGAIKGKKIGTTRTGLPKTNFGLTFLGLGKALQITDVKNYNGIIQKWKHLEPILFGRWSYFKEKVGRKETERFFLQSVRWSFPSSRSEEMMEDFRSEAIVAHFAMFREEIFDSDPEIFPESGYEQSDKKLRRLKHVQVFEKWLEAFKNDPQLMEYVRGIIGDESRQATVMKKWVDFLKQKLPNQTDIKKEKKYNEIENGVNP
ncbi:hypothetical protein ACFLRN_05235 [Thermoproteota archaeon]